MGKPRFKGVHFNVYSRNLRRATAFYDRLLAMKPAYRLEGVVGYVLFTGASFNICKGTPSKGAPALTLAVTGLAKIHRSMKKAFEAPPAKGDHALTAIVRDPDGNRIELAE